MAWIENQKQRLRKLRFKKTFGGRMRIEEAKTMLTEALTFESTRSQSKE